MPAITNCPKGHEIRSKADRTHRGFCRKCQADCDRRYRTECRDARRALRLMQAAMAL